MEENDVIQWLKKYFDKSDLSENNLKPVLHFSLLWNLFEHTYFDDSNHLTPATIITLSELSYNFLSDTDLNKMFEFLKKRYITDSDLNDKFSKVNFKNDERENFCKIVLKSESPTNEDKTKTIFIIIHRFRNNLFHGTKIPETLNIYEEPFKKINKFLMHFIEKTAKENSVNKQRFV